MKDFTDADIDAMVAEVQEQLLTPLIKSAQDDLAKSAKEKDMEKSAEPMAKEASDEASPKADSAPPSDGPSPDSPAPSPEAPSASPDEASAAPSPSPEGDPAAPGQDDASLEEQYGQLSDEDLQLHLQALKSVLMGRMGGPDAGAGLSASPSPDASAAAPPVADPAMSAAAAPPMAQKSQAMPPMMGKSEASVEKEELKKAQAEIAELKGDLNKVMDVIENYLNKPQRKVITTNAEFMAKSEMERPVQRKLSRKEVMVQLNKITREPSLKKSERESIDRYVLFNDEASLKEIEHLLKF